MRLIVQVVILYLLIADSEQSAWIHLGPQMYYINNENLVNWYGAINECARRGMTLLSLETKEESDRLKEYLKTSGQDNSFYWTSGSDLEHNEDFKNPNIDNKNRKFIWSSVGTPIGYTNWRDGEPNNFMNQKEQCIMLETNFTWTDQRCYHTINYICEGIRLNGYIAPTNWDTSISSSADKIYIT